ncbi:MAG: hypothetical protein EA367_08645 [Leptolyngbya sp. DLM2.Bin15]|nr:MAG: hypothetical protein EA367_08645 [Leptolyngbya sp. DLM2.Bin15]
MGLPGAPNANPISLSPGQTLTGSLGPGDPAQIIPQLDSLSRFVDTYSLNNLTPRTGIELTVASADFIPSIEIVNTATNETIMGAIGIRNEVQLRTFVLSNVAYSVRVTTTPGSANQGTYYLGLASLPEGIPGFQIDLQFLDTAAGPVPAAIQRLAQEATTRWQTLITADIPDASVSLAPGQCNLPLTAFPILNQPVDDLLILVRLDPSLSAAATAGPCRTRGLGTPTVVGQINLSPTLFAFDEATIRTVLVHEIGHVLGLGSGSGTWVRGLTNRGSTDPRQTTASAVRQYQALGGQQASIPVQLQAERHWRGDNEGGDSLGLELMTPTIRAGTLNPLSRITLGFLDDIDYTVNLDAADPFSVPSDSRHSITQEGRFIDLGNDYIPLPDNSTEGVELR